MIDFRHFSSKYAGMLSRILEAPKQSILLLGPRGTGKSTWIQEHFSGVPTYDLLNTREALRLAKEPGLLFQELDGLPEGSWVVIDEIQKVPDLLDEVHRLIEKKKLKFILSGSSARKLKGGGANLLAGRALLTQFFPLVSAEVDYRVPFSDVIQFGLLPMAYAGTDRQAYLKTYADTYLQEEIKGEALARNIGSFGRFLEVAARQNGQVTSVANISRDAQVARQTVQGYFDILADTLIGFWLPAWKLKRATKQIAHPKFYFFDPGVARALSGRLPYPPTPEEAGPLFETFMLHEVRAYLSYSKKDYPLFFWSSHNENEVDLFCETQKGFLAVEFKSASRWDKQYNKGLLRMKDEMKNKPIRCLGVYSGEREMLLDSVRVIPFTVFLKELWAGEMIV